MDYNFSPNIVREVREVEWEIRKYIKFPMDPKTGQKYIYSNGLLSKSYPNILKAKKLLLNIDPICAFCDGGTGGKI